MYSNNQIIRPFYLGCVRLWLSVLPPKPAFEIAYSHIPYRELVIDFTAFYFPKFRTKDLNSAIWQRVRVQ